MIVTPIVHKATDDAAYDTTDDAIVVFSTAYIIDLFKLMLTVGFNNKPSLGWSVEFEDIPANKIVFRNPANTLSLRLSPNENYTGSGSVAKYARYEFAGSYVDIDTHSNLQRSGVIACEVGDMDWIFAGYEDTFYFTSMRPIFTQFNYSSYQANNIWCGKYKSYRNDTLPFMCYGNGSTGTSYNDFNYQLDNGTTNYNSYLYYDSLNLNSGEADTNRNASVTYDVDGSVYENPVGHFNVVPFMGPTNSQISLSEFHDKFKIKSPVLLCTKTNQNYPIRGEMIGVSTLPQFIDEEVPLWQTVDIFDDGGQYVHINGVTINAIVMRLDQWDYPI